MEARSNLRRLITRAALVLVSLLVIIRVSHYLTSGKIIITSDNPHNTISLTQTGANTSATPKIFTAHTQLSVAVHTGEYIVTVEGSSLSTTQLIKLSSHKTLRYKINPIATSGVEPVAYQNARNIISDSSALIYLDSSGLVKKIDSQNNISTVSASPALQLVKWANSTYGIGQDSSGKLYVLDGSSTSLLNVPFVYGNAAVSFDVSADKKIYVSSGSAVYASDQSGHFNKIYSASSSKPILAASKNLVAVADSPSDADDEQKPLLAVIDTAGRVTKKRISAHRISWSPDGRYFLNEEPEAVVYDSSLHEVATLPSGTIVGSTGWLDNNNLFYSTGDKLWSYSLQDQRAQLFANTPLSNAITGLSISGDKAYIYLTTSDVSGNIQTIRKVGLRGQKVSDSLFQLQDILPKNLNDCSISLVNFSQASLPVVAIAPFKESDLSPQMYISEAQSELAQDGFDLSKLQFRLANSP